MSRSTRSYLQDMLAASRKIEDYTVGLNVEGFKNTSLVIDGVCMNLVIIGEAARALPAGFREQNPDVEWRNIVDLRNVITHEYFRLNLDRVWDIVQVELPKLRIQIEAILKNDDSGDVA